MSLGTGTLGSSTIGFSSVQVNLALTSTTTAISDFRGEKAVDLTLTQTGTTTYTGTASVGRFVSQTATTTTSLTATPTLGKSLVFAPTGTGALTYTPTTTGVSAGINLSSISFGDFGSTQGKLLVNMSTADTTDVIFASTLGKNVTLSPTATSASTFNSALGAFVSAAGTAQSELSGDVTKGRPIAIQPVDNKLGDSPLGNNTLGLTNQTARVVSNLFSSVAKGRTVALDAVSNSSLGLFRKVNLTLSSLATASSDWVVTKGIEVRVDSQTNTTLVLVPDFDEIIGKSRADGTQQQIVRSNGERIFILEAEGQID